MLTHTLFSSKSLEDDSLLMVGDCSDVSSHDVMAIAFEINSVTITVAICLYSSMSSLQVKLPDDSELVFQEKSQVNNVYK